MRYAIVIEKAGSNDSAHAPELPRCVATGDTIAETEQHMQEAIELHIDGLRENGFAVPEATSQVDYIDVAA